MKELDLRPKKIIPKIGFVIQDPVVCHHYEPVLRQFVADEIELILHQPHVYPALRAWAQRFGCQVSTSSERLALRQGYAVLVSNHYIGNLQPIPLAGYAPQRSASLLRMLGQVNVRFMYSLGVDAWNLSSWNRYYDYFLCFGAYQVQQLAEFAGQKLIMGYPRYDRLFHETFDREAWLQTFGCQTQLPIVVWLTTLKAYGGSLAHYAAHFASLNQAGYQVLVKPHPLAWQKEPEELAELVSHQFTALIHEHLDNLDLFQLADYVACDYGGSAFGAIYTDTPLLLLDQPGREHRDLSDSDNWLRQSIGHFSAETWPDLLACLQDSAYWQAQKVVRQQLRQQLFAEHRGQSAEVAAGHLRQIFRAATATNEPGLP